MESKIFAVITLIVVTIIINVGTQTLFPPKTDFIVRGPNSGIINFIQLPENSNEFSASCRLQIPDHIEATTLDLNQFLANSYDLKSGEKIKKTSRDLCGVRMHPVSKALNEAEFNLIIEYNNGTSLNIPFRTVVADNIENVTPVNVSRSSPPYSIQYFYEVEYHEFEDDSGNRITQKDITFSNHNSEKWIGHALAQFQMDEIRTDYNIIDDIDREKYTKRTTLETNDSIIFQCDLQLTTSTYSGLCFARKPDGSLIYINTGLLTDKYSSYDTDTKKGICSLEILKPYAETDKGIWEIVFATGVKTGCIFSVEGENVKKAKNEYISSTHDNPIQLDVDVTPTQFTTHITMTIKCEYPDEIEYCVLRNPHGDIEKDDIDENLLVLGRCSYTVNPISGRWACSMKSKDSDALKTLHYQMNTYNNSHLVTNSMSVKKFLAESIEIMCQTRFGNKLEYCIFESPEGIWYRLSEVNRNRITRISYVGRGLNYGDCGIQIASIQQEDFGNWTCHGKITNNYLPNFYPKLYITLVEDEIIGSAVILGTSIAFGIILLLLGTWFIFRRYRARRNRNLDNTEIEIE